MIDGRFDSHVMLLLLYVYDKYYFLVKALSIMTIMHAKMLFRDSDGILLKAYFLVHFISVDKN